MAGRIADTRTVSIPAILNLWIQWTLVSAVGGALSNLYIFRYLFSVIRGIEVVDARAVNEVIAVLYGMLFFQYGLPLGIAQWLVLRRRLSRSGVWISRTAVGWLLAYVIGGGVFVLGGGAACVVAGWVVGLLLFGLIQWALLHDNQLHHAGWWILTTVLGWGASLVVSFKVADVIQVNVLEGNGFFFARAVTFVLLGFLSGLFTGGPMAWLLMQSRK
jgi:hypothetical protein